MPVDVKKAESRSRLSGRSFCRSGRRTFGAADGPRHLEKNAGDAVVIRQVLVLIGSRG